MDLSSTLLLYLTVSSLLLSQSSATADDTPSGAIHRSTADPQILAAIPPATGANSQPFLTSQSGTYAAYLIRYPGGDALGHDSCYVQVQDASSGQSAWESECAAVGSADECSLVMTAAGLGVFGGSEAVWGPVAGGASSVEALELADDGGLRITDEEGVLAWQSGDEPRANQGCGLAAEAAPSPPDAPVNGGGDLPIGSPPPPPGPPPPVLAPVNGALTPGAPVNGPLTSSPPVNGGLTPAGSGFGSVPFGKAVPAPVGAAPHVAAPLSGGGGIPFGRVAPGSGPQAPAGFGQQPAGLKGLNQAGGLPLVDNTPYNGGGLNGGKRGWGMMGLFVISLVCFVFAL